MEEAEEVVAELVTTKMLKSKRPIRVLYLAIKVIHVVNGNNNYNNHSNSGDAYVNDFNQNINGNNNNSSRRSSSNSNNNNNCYYSQGQSQSIRSSNRKQFPIFLICNMWMIPSKNFIIKLIHQDLRLI